MRIIHNAACKEEGGTGKTGEAPSAVYPIISGLIHLRGTRLILGIPSIWRRAAACLPSQEGEKGARSFSPAFTLDDDDDGGDGVSSRPRRELVMPQH